MGFLTLLRRRGTATGKKLAVGDRLVATALGAGSAAARCEGAPDRTSFASAVSDGTSGDDELLAP
jgi:hypothetical protein